MFSEENLNFGPVSSGLQFTTAINDNDRTIEDSLKELETLVIMSTKVHTLDNDNEQVQFKTNLYSRDNFDLNVVRQKIDQNRDFDLSTFDTSIEFTTGLNPCMESFISYNNYTTTTNTISTSETHNSKTEVPRSINTNSNLPDSLLSSLGLDSLNQNYKPDSIKCQNNNYSYNQLYSNISNLSQPLNMECNVKRQVKSSAIIPTWVNIPADSKFFIIKCNNVEHIKKSFYNNIWSSTHFGNKRLSEHYKKLDQTTGAKLFLFFSVNGSGKFCGVAEMVSDLKDDLDTSIWTESEKFGNAFNVRWIIVRDINNKYLKRFLLPNNEMKPVTNSRDTQEIPPLIGIGMLKVFKSQTFHTTVTSFLDDSY